MASSVRYRSLQISPDVLSGKTSLNSNTKNANGTSSSSASLHTSFAAESPLAGTTLATTATTTAAIPNGKQLFVVTSSRSPSGSPSNHHINGTHSSINNHFKSPRSSPNNNGNSSTSNGNGNHLLRRKNPYTTAASTTAAFSPSSFLSRGVYTLLCLSLVVTVGLLHTSIRSTASVTSSGILLLNNNNNKPVLEVVDHNNNNNNNNNDSPRKPYEVNQVMNHLRQNAATVDRTRWQPQQQQQQQQPAAALLENNNSTITHNYNSNNNGTLHPLVLRDDSAMVDLSTNHIPPRVLFLDGLWVGNHASRQIILYDDDDDEDAPADAAVLRMAVDDWQPPHHNDDNDNNNGDEPECVPKAAWQTRSYPNCNSIHEIHVASAMATPPRAEKKNDLAAEEALSVLGEGWFRTTWQWDRPLPAKTKTTSTTTSTTLTESVVLKTLRIPREFLTEYYELHRRDAVAMERLTSSPFVVDIFGYCGQSVINELADFPYPGIQNLEKFNRRMRGQEHSVRAHEMKLRMGTSIALGLADIHAGGSSPDDNDDDDDEQVYMAHYDLNPRNIALFAGGRPKINDFNIAEFLYYNPRTNETCPFPSRLHEPWWRAPEEMNTTHTAMVNEKVDVYALGNILYHTLTTHSARGKQHKERMDEVRPQVAANIRPEIPAVFRNSTDPSVVAMLQAMDLCWQTDPAKRGTAEQVAAILYEALLKISPVLRNDNDNDQESNPEESVVVPPVSDAGVAEDDDTRMGTMEDKNALGEHDEVVVAAAAAASAAT